jgi:predicted hydrocarbon binding protein
VGETIGESTRPNGLLIKKGDLGIQEANLHTLLKLVDGIMMKNTVALKTGTDDVAIEVAKSPACYDLADFYERTDCITQWGPVAKYDNDLTRRFVEKIEVNDDGIEVRFKAGISVDVK